MDKRLLKLFVVVILVILLTGCGDDAPQQQPVAHKPAKKVNESPAVAVVADEIEPVVEYVYNPIGKRDPFENPLKAIVEITNTDGVPLTPLQKFDLVQLRLIGVIVGRGEPRAMVISPDGKSFILEIGTKIGKNNGLVTAINTDAVRVKEKYFDFAGEVKTSIQEIKLPKQGGVK